MSNIKVMVIDDSAVVRQVLSSIISESHGMEVIDTAPDPIFALQKLEKVKPDVITLDVEMPRMDGITFLKKLMDENPIPVVMCSTLTQKSSDTSIKALQLGAVEIVGKPTSNMKQELLQQKQQIANAIRVASKARLDRMKPIHTAAPPIPHIPEKLSADAIIPKKTSPAFTPSSKLIVIGASTGGTQALEYVLSLLNIDTPGVAIVQHMPEAFTASFARRLNSVSQVHIKQAEDGDLIETGKALIAPGGKHMLVRNHGGQLSVNVKDGPLVSRHRPSVDVLFRSAAQAAAKQTLGIIMTGMGDDGAIGMKEMFDAGAFTIAQDEESCVIFGMPAVAINKGGVRKITPLQYIPEMINSFHNPVHFNQLI
ncbi:MAG: chemotaxis response regulator protein-glutamate methylesterase [Gammaproteobacteria bacterium]|nr:chemotaxis response regulator protein-glutamate methylesterase [Gammaproteobacteria bacterium]